jgi:hypothetical protein
MSEANSHTHTEPHILIFMFLDCRRENRRFWTERQKALPVFSLLLIFSWIKVLISYCYSQILELCHVFEGSVSHLYVVILPRIPVARQQHSVFTSSPSSILVSIEVPLFIFMLSMLSPNSFTSSIIRSVSHLISLAWQPCLVPNLLQELFLLGPVQCQSHAFCCLRSLIS